MLDTIAQPYLHRVKVATCIHQGSCLPLLQNSRSANSVGKEQCFTDSSNAVFTFVGKEQCFTDSSNAWTCIYPFIRFVSDIQADDFEDDPTCGWYRIDGERVPDSQGFSCTCSSQQVWDHTWTGSNRRT